MTTQLFSDFSGGMDTRQGVMLDDAKRFQLLTNAIITPGRKPERRPPLVEVPGEIDTDTTKGFVRLDGVWYAYAPKGVTPAHSLTEGVTTLFFDLPDYCTTTGWSLIASGIYGTVPYAVIRHDYPGGTVTSIIKLHLWDKRKDKPTYCEDPSCPTNWSKELPQHIYGNGIVGEFKDYRPVVAIASNKVHMSRTDGNVGLCKTNDARVWNSRSVDQVLTQGDLYYFIQPVTDNGLCEFTVSLPWEDLAKEGRWAAYVFELLLPDGSWIQLEEVGQTPLDHNTYWPAPATSRFDPTKNEIKVKAKLSNTPGRILRFRAIAKAAPVSVISGGRFDPGTSTSAPIINDAQIQWQGASYKAPKTTIVIPPASAGKTFLIGIPLPGSSVPAARLIVNPGLNPYNGYERYRIRLAARAVVHSSGTYFVSTLTGTVSITSLSNVVIGVGTLFTDELLVGDRILINGEERVVTAITDDLNFTVENVFTTTISGDPCLRRQTYDYASDISAGNTWYVQKEVDATLYKAGLGLASFINTSFYDNTGKTPSLISQLKNRLGVFYDAGFQLWLTDPDPTGYRYLAGTAVGTGRNTEAQAVQIMDDIFVATDTGPRSFSATGLNYDAAQDQNLGEILDGVNLPPLVAASWWSYKNLYTIAGAKDGVLTVLALTFIRSIKANAWSLFTFRGINSVDSFTPDGGRLYIQSGRKLYYLDGLGTDYIDATDDPAFPYETKGRWHFLFLGSPESNKRMTYMDVVQTGPATWRWFPNPCLPDQAIGPIMLPKGPSWGRARVPLACLGSAISFEFSTRSRTGYRLEQLQVEYQTLKR